MAEVVVAAAAWAAGYGASTWAAAAGYGAFAAAAAGFVASAVVGYAGSQIIGGPASPSKRDRRESIRSPASPRRLIYGRVRTGGILVFASSAGKNNRYMHMACVLGEGEMEKLGPVMWLNDKPSTEEQFEGLVEFEFFSGTANQQASQVLIDERPNDWTAEHRLRGISWVRMKLTFEAESFPQGLPAPAWEVYGRKIFDPRTNNVAWSENPAVCVLDYLRHPLGIACPDHLIDFPSFIAAANICDELVPSIDPSYVVNGQAGFVRRYTLNGIVDLSGEPAKIIEDMQSACAGRLIFSAGKYRFYAGAFAQPHALPLTGEMLRSDPVVRKRPSRTTLFNTVRGTYVEPKQDWHESDFPEQIDQAGKTIDGGEIVQDMDYEFTTNGAIAQRLARLSLNKARTATTMALECNWSALNYRLWDVIELRIPELSVAGETYRITEYTLAEGGGVNLSLISERVEDYAWDHNLQERIIPQVAPPKDGEEILPVANLVVSGAPRVEVYGTVPRLSATWAFEPAIRYFEVQWKTQASPSWDNSILTQSPRFSTNEVNFGTSYILRVRYLLPSGQYSPWNTAPATLVLNDTVAPGPPTGLSVASTSSSHTIRWRSPVDSDFDRSNVYVNTVSSPTTASLLVSVVGLRDTNQSHVATPAAAPRFYYVTSVDRTGNESARTFAGQGAAA